MLPSLTRYLLVLLALVAVLLAGILLWAHTAARPKNLGLIDGHLAPCPDTPNCVATENAAPDQTLPPIPYTGSREAAQRRLVRILQAMPRAVVVESRPGYLAAEFHSRFFGFIDDVEFRFPDDKPVIHFRSASRLGRSDLGVNRARMERIARAFAAAP